MGLCTAAEASRLLELPTARVRRWLGGYTSAEAALPSLWAPQLPRLKGQLGLGLLDLMQVRVVKQLVTQTKISLQQLRGGR